MFMASFMPPVFRLSQAAPETDPKSISTAPRSFWGASSKRAKLYCSVLYAMLTRQLVNEWSRQWGVFHAIPTPALDPLFIAYNTGAGGKILHTI